MCGFSVIIGNSKEENRVAIKNMLKEINYRGPDNSSIIQAEYLNHNATFGFNRLSIIDLSENANQPFISSCKNYVLVFNGEIYNFKEIKGELKTLGHIFSTSSDTEVFLKAYIQWGIDALNKFNGMFAFVILDKNKKKLFFGRDRFGVKPIYFYKDNTSLVICSEIKQFLQYPSFKKELNLSVVRNFLINGSHKGHEETFLKNIYEVQPSHLYIVKSDTGNLRVNKNKWYELEKTNQNISLEEAKKQFKELFFDSVKLRLNADVPVGTGLSGGLDSSSIVCSVKELSKIGFWDKDIHTFSARFKKSALDEGDYINAVTSKTDSIHHEIYPNSKNLFEELPKLSKVHDEPVLTSAVYAQWCVYKLVAESGIKVTLDGHGADEILGGYKSFYRPLFNDLLKKKEFNKIRKEMSNLVSIHGYSKITPLVWLLSGFITEDKKRIIKNILSISKIREKWVARGDNEDTIKDKSDSLNKADFYEYSKLMLNEFSLQPQLQWADRNSMAFSVESRAPFLDYRLVEFCINLPTEYKLTGGINKIILRESIGEMLPKKVIQRKGKQGFESPESSWLLSHDNHNLLKEVLKESEENNSDIISSDAFRYSEKILSKEEKYDEFLWKLISFSEWRKSLDI